MPGFKLVRNSRVFLTTNVDPATGVIPSSGPTISNTNTFEIQVLDGFSFSQASQQTTIQVSEGGNTPVRGQRSFNTSLDPVEYSFSTYVRPRLNGAIVDAEEKVLWNALMHSQPIDATGLAITASALTRATTLTNVATLTCSAANFTTAGISVGDSITIKGATGTTAKEWNSVAVITTLAPNATATTAVTLAYLVAPNAAATTAATVASLSIRKGAWTEHIAAGTDTAYSLLHTGGSNKNQLQKFGLYFLVDDALYAVDNCALDQVSLDFNLEGIATLSWTGNGTALRQLNASGNTAAVSGANPAVFSGTGNATGNAAAKTTTANYITNKLSTMTLISGIQGGGGTTYTVPITGGNLTYANNISYVVPANLGVVNTAIGYFTGSRSISGTVTAYLKTGSNNPTATLLNDILAGTTTTSETKFRLQLELGGISNPIRVEFDIKGCVLQVPAIETADVVAVNINFTAQGFDPLLAGNTYDLEQVNDLFVRYYSS
jgi:hypothetical protein